MSDDLPGALAAYEHARKPRVDRIVAQSRRLGAVAQWRSALGGWLRRQLVRATPARTMRRQLDALYGVPWPE